MAAYRALVVIPARGGSKRLPKKNLRELNGKPLLAHSIEAALESGCFSDVLVSSDDEEILDVARSYGVIADKRPERLAHDTAKAREVVWEIFDRPENSNKYDFIALMLPTAPFRRGEDIKAAFSLITDDVTGAVSVTEFDMSPQMAVRIHDDNVLEPVFNPSPLITGATRSQDMEKFYRPNGAFYIARWNAFDTNRNFFKGTVRAHVMPRAVDIDDLQDFDYAQFLMSRCER